MKSLVVMALVAGMILCMVFAAGCSTPNPSAAQPTSPVTGARSYSDAELKQIVTNFDAYAEKARADWGVPGMAIAIVRGDEVLLAKGYGVKTVGGSDPVTTGTVFQIASTSKAFTSAMVGMEVDRGTLKWDDKVTTFLPDFKMKDPYVTKEFTITDTMAHRSGLPGYWGDDLMILGYNDSYSIHALRYADPVSGFRSQYAYQNVVYSVPTVIVEKTTGKSWEENLKSRIFTPLKMTSSSTNYESFRTAKDVAAPHLYKVTTDGSMVSESIPADSPIRKMTYLQPGAGGINSNVHDMANWLTFQMGNGTFNGQQLISEENLNYVHSPKTPLSANMQDPMFYCQGWLWQETKYGPIIQHSGAVGGFKNYVAYSPKDKVGIVILSNNLQSSLPDTLFYQFFSLYFGDAAADVSGDTLKDTKAHNAGTSAVPAATVAAHASLPLSAYSGTYTNTPYGTAIVSEQNGNLTVTMGPAQMKFPLVSANGNVFMVSEGFMMGRPVTFNADTDGTVKSMTFLLDTTKQVFARA
ncbi:MAG: serine hydrolase [Methanoregula sp.]|nr:serine hydrolase [Methanoregula sp.]